MYWRVLVAPWLQRRRSVLHISLTYYSRNADCYLQCPNCLMTFSPTFQVHGIIRRSSSFNTGRIDHIYKDRHTTGVKVRACIVGWMEEQ